MSETKTNMDAAISFEDFKNVLQKRMDELLASGKSQKFVEEFAEKSMNEFLDQQDKLQSEKDLESKFKEFINLYAQHTCILTSCLPEHPVRVANHPAEQQRLQMWEKENFDQYYAINDKCFITKRQLKLYEEGALVPCREQLVCFILAAQNWIKKLPIRFQQKLNAESKEMKDILGQKENKDLIEKMQNFLANNDLNEQDIKYALDEKAQKEAKEKAKNAREAYFTPDAWEKFEFLLKPIVSLTSTSVAATASSTTTENKQQEGKTKEDRDSAQGIGQPRPSESKRDLTPTTTTTNREGDRKRGGDQQPVDLGLPQLTEEQLAEMQARFARFNAEHQARRSQIALDQKRSDEARKRAAEEAAKREADAKRAAEEAKRNAEARRVIDEKKRAEEKRLAEETEAQRKLAEAKAAADKARQGARETRRKM